MENGIVKRNADREEDWMRGPRVLTAALLSLASLSFSCASFARSDAFASGRPMGVVQSDSLSELSGIAASRRNPGVLWVHNDSGDAPQIYAINEKAQLLGACNIQGATSATGRISPSGRDPIPIDPTCTSATSATTRPSVPRSSCTECRSRRWMPPRPSAQ